MQTENRKMNRDFFYDTSGAFHSMKNRSLNF